MSASPPRALLPSGLLAVLSLACGGKILEEPPGPTAPCHVIEFESAEVDGFRAIVDPYVDPETNVVFEGFDPSGGAEVVVGVRTDARTCPNDRDPGNMLVTSTGPEDALGHTTFPIRATFPKPLAPPVAVTVEALITLGPTEPARLQLLDEQGREVAVASERVQPTLWPCPFWWPSAAGLLRLRAQAEVSVSSAILEGPPSYVAWWDHFVFSEGRAPDLDGCHSLDTGIPDSQRCPINDGTPDYQCVPKPAGITSCSDCALDCLNAGIHDFIEAQRMCVGLPTEIRCGPNPDESEGCCFVVQVEEARTCPAD